jgi:hypothetical protein
VLLAAVNLTRFRERSITNKLMKQPLNDITNKQLVQEIFAIVLKRRTLKEKWKKLRELKKLQKSTLAKIRKTVQVTGTRSW